MKGYYTASAYMGWVPRFGKYIQFPTHEEYVAYMREEPPEVFGSKCA